MKTNLLFNFCKEWVSKRFIPFTIDDIRQDFISSGGVLKTQHLLPNIIKRFDDLGLIKWNDEKFVKSKAKGNKGRFVKEWISKEYSEKQSLKRLSEETSKARELEKRQIKLL